MLKGLLLGCVALYMVAPSYAHDQWADGSTVPPWVKSICCGPEDVHHLTEDQVHKVDKGYMIDGYPDLIPNERVLPSQDGDYWAFYRESIGGDGKPWFSVVYCFFVPMSM